ncbi:MAG: ABC transporter ATP-binding protein [Pseudomonadota bacterium]
MSAISLKSLAHSYSRVPKNESDYAIHTMNHEWESGGAYALLGPSGCGKSTLLNLISGLLSPSAGNILFDGADVTYTPTAQRNIAQVFQFPVVYDSMTVYDNLAFPLRNRQVGREQLDQRVREIAALLELEPILMQRARALSADQQQKVSMGRGLVRSDVSAILFDEPLTVIDPQLKWRLRRKLKQIHQQFDTTMIYVTHDQVEALTFADKVAVMYEGRIVQFASPQELFEKPSHRFVGYFIGSPGMNFFHANRRGDGLAIEDAPIKLGDALARTLASYPISDISIGIRPEYVEVLNPDTSASDAITCQLNGVEDLGSYKILSLVLGAQMFKSRYEASRAVPDGCVKVRFPTDHIRCYAQGVLVDA